MGGNAGVVVEALPGGSFLGALQPAAYGPLTDAPGRCSGPGRQSFGQDLLNHLCSTKGGEFGISVHRCRAVLL